MLFCFLFLDIRRVKKCEKDGGTITPSCPSDGRISIIYANYGRTAKDEYICSYGGSHKDVDTCDKHKNQYIQRAKELCNGKKSCTLKTKEFGDPCPGTYKYLEVLFTCIGKPFLFAF